MNKTIKKLNNNDFEVLTEMEECVVCGVETNEPHRPGGCIFPFLTL